MIKTILSSLTFVLSVSLATALLTACQSLNSHSSLYTELGGQQGIEKIADRFVRLVIKDPRIEDYFEETNLDRFYEKLVEQFCELSGGPCTYSGDDMVTVHKGMNVNEADFNALVEVLQQAMRDTDIPLGAQNRLLALLAPMRPEIIYR